MVSFDQLSGVINRPPRAGSQNQDVLADEALVQRVVAIGKAHMAILTNSEGGALLDLVRQRRQRAQVRSLEGQSSMGWRCLVP